MGVDWPQPSAPVNNQHLSMLIAGKYHKKYLLDTWKTPAWCMYHHHIHYCQCDAQKLFEMCISKFHEFIPKLDRDSVLSNIQGKHIFWQNVFERLV